MSIILDALRKSESARLREAEALHAGVPRARARARLPWWVWAVALLLIANLGLLVWLLNRAPSQAAAPATGPAAAVQDLDRVALAGKESVGAVVANRAAQGQSSGADAPRRTPDVPPAAYPVRAPTDPMPDRELDASAAAAIAAENAAAAPAEAATAPAPSATAVGSTLPTGLAALEVSLHYYDGPGGRSFVTINGHTARAGTVLPEGPVVEQVTPEGAILSYRGQRFLLPRN